MILNEKKFVEQLLNQEVSFEDYKISRIKLIEYLFMYYPNDVDKVQQALIHILGESFPLENYMTQIFKINKELCKNPKHLQEIDYIPIYQEEINIVQTLDDEKLQCLLITAYVIARALNKDGWLNRYNKSSLKEWFKLANVRANTVDKNLLVGELIDLGYCQDSKMSDNINVQVDINHSGTESLRIYELENIGNQYLHKYKDGWKMCQSCGKMYKIKKKDYSSKYCKKCGYETKLSQNNRYYMEKK